MLSLLARRVLSDLKELSYWAALGKAGCKFGSRSSLQVVRDGQQEGTGHISIDLLIASPSIINHSSKHYHVI
jgi:hypothetical protein